MGERGLRAPRRALLVIVALALMTTTAAATSTEPSFGDWASANWFALVVAAFHVGVSWKELIDHRRRLKQLEEHVDKLRVRRG